MVALIDRMDSSPVVCVIVFPMILSFALGLLILAIALWRARFVQGWAPHWCSAQSCWTGRAGRETPASVSIAKQLLAFAAFAYVGLQMLRMPDGELDSAAESAIDGTRVVATALPA